MSAWTLSKIESALRASWSADLSSPEDITKRGWSADNPSWGHCDITALVLHDLCGGELMLGEVTSQAGRPEGYHWWNRLPGGLEVDLTREQFVLGERVTPGRPVVRPPGRLRRRWEEYQELRRRVSDRLGSLPGVLAREGGRRLAYVDHGGPGRALLALHGHFEAGATFDRLARDLAPDWRLIALDQRGHGRSDRPAEFSREGYVADAAALLDHLGLGPIPVLGHGLGGVNAYQLAAWRPDLVSALVVEDIGAEPASDLAFCLDWPYRAPRRAELVSALGAAAVYLEGSLQEYEDGWGTAFVPQDMVDSQRSLAGDHWGDWLAPTAPVCPVLLVRGRRSDELTGEHAAEMVRRRPGARSVELPTGHRVHAGAPAGFAREVAGFLAELG